MAKKRRRSRGGSDGLVNRRTAIGLLLVGGAGVAGIQSTGAFSSVIGDRGFSVGTTGDHAALLGIDRENPSGQDGDIVNLLTLTNRTPTVFTEVTVSVLSTGNPALGVSGIETPRRIEPGATGTVRGTLSCESPVSNVTVDLEISVSGPEDTITAQRQVQLSCEESGAPTIASVDWKGDGINPIASPDDSPITVDVWYYAGNGQPRSGSDEFGVECDVATSTNHNIRADLPGQASTHVAVYIHEADESWYHPSFDPEDSELTGWEPTADGVRWGAGTIASAFDVTCEEKDDGDRPPAGDVYQIRDEPWLADRERIFEIIHDNVWSVEWDFGDGTTSTNHYVEHTYSEDGTYEMSVTVVIDGEEYTYSETVDMETEG